MKRERRTLTVVTTIHLVLPRVLTLLKSKGPGRMASWRAREVKRAKAMTAREGTAERRKKGSTLDQTASVLSDSP
jgi:hypothetical protein